MEHLNDIDMNALRHKCEEIANQQYIQPGEDPEKYRINCNFLSYAYSPAQSPWAS